MTDEDIKNLQGAIKNVVREEIGAALEPIKKTLDEHTNRLERLEDKVDASTADVIDLQNQTKAVWDKIALGHTRNKREIDEIKYHLDMPLMPDAPEL